MDQIIIPDSVNTKAKRYQFLIKQLNHLLSENDNSLSSLSNLTAALNETIDYASWVGFYLYDGNKLYLGPFQGKVACSEIEYGSGVCGTAAKSKKTVIVKDVNKFPGHIACDPSSKSEIVVPIITGEGNIFGVLDLDSTELSSFDETDGKYLEEICNLLANKIQI